MKEKVLEFLACFCNGDVDSLSALLAEEFCFKGPFIECTSKEAYISALNEDPPIDCQIEVVKLFEDGEDVGIFYTFKKSDVTTPMAQFFKFNEGKIAETLLVFDSGVFASSKEIGSKL